MLRLRAVAEAAEVDDPADSLALRHLREVPGALPLALLEVARGPAAHRVDQVVGDLDAAPGPAQRLRIEHVGLVQLEPALGQLPRSRAIAHQAAHLPVSIGEGRGEAPTDEPRGPGDEGAASHAHEPLPLRGHRRSDPAR